MLGLWNPKERTKTQQAMLGGHSRAHSAPFFTYATKEKKEKGLFVFCVYFRLLSTNAAATATMMMTAAPIATYVMIGVALAGGITTGLGVGASVGAVVC